jgi:hypothetical protein
MRNDIPHDGRVSDPANIMVKAKDISDEVILEIHVPRSITEETIKLQETKVYALGDLVVNRPMMDVSNWNPVPSETDNPYKGWSYTRLHVLSKCLADKVAGLSQKKDMNWKEVLDTVHLEALVIAAFNKEIHSLTEKQRFFVN